MAGATSARSLLLTVLGELVAPAGEPVWTSSLLRVLAGLGLEEQTARQAITRGVSAGWLIGQRHGREVRWELADKGIELISDLNARVAAMCAGQPAWNGDWLILMVTIPQQLKGTRKRLYTALGRAGFGNPAPGIWVTPHQERAAEARAAVESLGLRAATFAFAGPSVSVGLSDAELVRRAWQVDSVAARYERWIDAHRDAGEGDELLYRYLSMVSEWQAFPYLDPCLPEAVAPHWIGRRAATLFTDRQATRAPAARHHWHSLT